MITFLVLLYIYLEHFIVHMVPFCFLFFILTSVTNSNGESVKWYIILGKPDSVWPVSCLPVLVNEGSLISARGLRGGSWVRVWSSLNWLWCRPLLLFVNRCVCLNGSLSWSCYTSQWGLSTSHPLTIFSSMTSFQLPRKEKGEKRRTMMLAERLEVSTDSATVFSVGAGTLDRGWISTCMGGMGMLTSTHLFIYTSTHFLKRWRNDLGSV